MYLEIWLCTRARQTKNICVCWLLSASVTSSAICLLSSARAPGEKVNSRWSRGSVLPLHPQIGRSCPQIHPTSGAQGLTHPSLSQLRSSCHEEGPGHSSRSALGLLWTRITESSSALAQGGTLKAALGAFLSALLPGFPREGTGAAWEESAWGEGFATDTPGCSQNPVRHSQT